MGRPKISGWEGHLHKVLYARWSKMIQRCDKPYSTSYKNYGKRGISVCMEWRDFKVFEKWALENGFEPILTLDRIDNDGDYCPENCRWVTMQKQGFNRRNTKYVTIDGVTKSVAEFAYENGVSANTALQRIKLGWDPKRAVSEPPHRAVGILKKRA